jgi:hypothetical protein
VLASEVATLLDAPADQLNHGEERQGDGDVHGGDEQPASNPRTGHVT